MRRRRRERGREHAVFRSQKQDTVLCDLRHAVTGRTDEGRAVYARREVLVPVPHWHHVSGLAESGWSGGGMPGR